LAATERRPRVTAGREPRHQLDRAHALRGHVRRRRLRLRGSRLALGRRLRAPPAPGDRPTAELLGLLVRQVELAHALARIPKGDPNRRAFSFRNFDTGHVRHEHRLPRQTILLRWWKTRPAYRSETTPP